MTGSFTWQQLTGMIKMLVALAGLSGLIWAAAQQSAKVDTLDKSVAAIETRQDLDHDTLIKLESGVEYLVRREKARADRGEL